MKKTVEKYIMPITCGVLLWLCGYSAPVTSPAHHWFWLFIGVFIVAFVVTFSKDGE